MKQALSWGAIVLTVYLASGFYVVRGNEQAVVRRFGRADRALVASGLHFDLPWPFARIERVNRHELRTLTVGIATADMLEEAGFLRNINLDRQGEFLTGDKNIINIQASVHYAIASPHDYFFGCQSPETGLKLLAESLVAEKVAQSGIDFIHPLGLKELQSLLTTSLREAAESRKWGVAVDSVTLAGLPPVEVKAAFLEVSNARAGKDRLINQEQSRAERLLAASQASAQQTLDRAAAERLARIESARGSADRFVRLIDQFQSEAETGKQTVADVRRATMQRVFAAALDELLPRLSRKVVLDPARPVDLTIFPNADERPKAAGPRPAEK